MWITFFLDENMSQNTTKRVKKNLSNDKRHAIYLAMLKRSVNGKIKHGITKGVAAEFGVPVRAVQRIWKRAKETSSQEKLMYHILRPKIVVARECRLILKSLKKFLCLKEQHFNLLRMQ